MDLKIGIRLSIGINDVIDEAFFRIPTPGSARTEIQTIAIVFAIRNDQGLPCSVAGSMELAAGIDQTFDLVSVGHQDVPDHGIVVAEFRVGGDDNACLFSERRFQIVIRGGCRS